MTTKPDPVVEEFPGVLMIRDTKLFDDLGGLGQRIYTTAGQGYKKIRYVREDLVRSQAEKAALYESTREALEWLIKRDYLPFHVGRGMLASAASVLNDPDCLAIIKKMIGEKHE